MRSDFQDESLDLNDEEETQQPVPAPLPSRSAAPKTLPLKTTSLPLKSNLPLAPTKPKTPSPPALEEPSLEETEKDEESILFSDPQVIPPEPQPVSQQARWATAAEQEVIDHEVPTDKEDNVSEHNELEASRGPEELKGTSQVTSPTPAEKEGVTNGAGAHDAYNSDAAPSVHTQPSPRDTTPPSHSEAEDRVEEEAESVSSPHSSPGVGSPPLFSPKTPSKISGKDKPLTPISGFAPPSLNLKARTDETTPTKLASSVKATTNARMSTSPQTIRQPVLTAASSSRPAREPTPEYQESSDFTSDMVYKPRGAKAYKQFLAEKRSSVHHGSPFQHDDDDRSDAPAPTDPTTDQSIGLEPTFIDGQSSSQQWLGGGRSSPRQNMGTSPPPGLQSSAENDSGRTQQDGMEIDRPVVPPSSPPRMPPIPSSPPPGRLGDLPMSEDGPLNVPGDAELFGETMDSEPSPHRSSSQSQNYSFQATQVLNPAIESQSPTKSVPTPLKPTMSTTSATSRVSESRMLKRRNRSSVVPTPPVLPRSPSPVPDGAETYTDTYKDPSGTIPQQAPENAPPEPEKAASVHSIARSVRTEVEDDEQPAAAEENMDVDPPQEPPVLTGIHEIETGSIEHDPVARPSPNKYGRKGKGRQVEHSPAPSSSSSSAPSDPEDNTFQPQTQTQEPSLSPLKGKGKAPASSRTSPSKASRDSRSSRLASSGLHGSRSASVASNRTASRPSRNKRKNLSPTPSFDGDSDSSSAPEDLEDFTFRPPPKKAKKSKKQPAKMERKASRKAAKTKEPEAGPSRRRASVSASRTVRAASAVPTPIPTQQDGDDEPLRVLALWSKTRDYYIGTVTARNKTGYRVSFDDGLNRTVPADRMRLLHIRKGETITCGDNQYVVDQDFTGNGKEILGLDSKKNIYSVQSKQLAISQSDIEKNFGDRLVPLIELESRFPAVTASGKRSSLTSVAPGECPEFENKVFLITGDVKDALKRTIEAHGGVVVPDWESVFTLKDDSYELSAGGVPFLINNSEPGTILTPKVMAALAAGMPILSAAYIEEAIRGPVDWRTFLVAPGYSAALRAYASQDIADDWGAEGWQAATAKSKRQPLAGKQVLFVEPSAKFDKGRSLKVSWALVGQS